MPMIFLYNLLFALILVGSFPYLLFKLLEGKDMVGERLGFSLKERLHVDGRPIWIHAASVGEMSAAASVARALRRILPGTPVAVSSTTVAGLERSRTLIPEADVHFIAPLDFTPIISRVLSNLKPKALIIVEAEIWPAMIGGAKSFGCYVAIVSGKISEGGFRRYMLIRPFMARVFRLVDVICAQTEGDRLRFIELGAAADRVKVTGNVKALAVSDLKGDARLVRGSLGISPDERVVTFGCVREGEEEIVARAIAELKSRFPKLVSIFAPRHMNRLGESERALSRAGLRWVRRSRIASGGPSPERDVILLDTMGELSSIYSIAEVAFIGGSFIPVGGHNPFEPAAWGIPVVFGPYMRQEGCEALESEGAAFRVEDPSELSEKIAFLLGDPGRARASGEMGRRIVRERSESATRTVSCLVEGGLKRTEGSS